MFDIHCHLLPSIDDGAATWDDCYRMAELAVQDGIEAVIVTPHQLGNFHANDGDRIRQLTKEAQERLRAKGIDLQLLPGADVRIESEIVAHINRGTVLTLGDHRRHVLLELPHELYFPIEPLLLQLERFGLVGILSHPERNRGILGAPNCVKQLVDAGCLMQVTAGSLTGAFGKGPMQLAETFVKQGLVHFIATDAHGHRTRRPKLSAARELVTQWVGESIAFELFVANGRRVACGEPVPSGRFELPNAKSTRRSWWSRGAA